MMGRFVSDGLARPPEIAMQHSRVAWHKCNEFIGGRDGDCGWNISFDLLRMPLTHDPVERCLGILLLLEAS